MHQLYQGAITCDCPTHHQPKCHPPHNPDPSPGPKTRRPQIQELTKPAAGQPIDPDFKYLGIVAWLALNMLMYEPDDPALHRHVTMLCSNEWSRGDAANAAAAEAALRAGGYDPLLTEADLEQLTHLLIPYARRSMAVVPQQAQMIAMLRQAAPRATRHLLQMEPGSASLKNLHAFMLSLDPTRPREAVAAFREVLQAAQETKCEWPGRGASGV